MAERYFGISCFMRTTGFDITPGIKCNFVFELFEIINSPPLRRYVFLQGYDFT